MELKTITLIEFAELAGISSHTMRKKLQLLEAPKPILGAKKLGIPSRYFLVECEAWLQKYQLAKDKRKCKDTLSLERRKKERKLFNDFMRRKIVLAGEDNEEEEND